MTYPNSVIGYRKPSMTRPARRSEDPRVTLFRFAAELLDSGLCIRCERAPALAGSHLCAACRLEDPDGVLDARSPSASPARA